MAVHIWGLQNSLNSLPSTAVTQAMLCPAAGPGLTDGVDVEGGQSAVSEEYKHLNVSLLCYWQRSICNLLSQNHTYKNIKYLSYTCLE